MGSNCEALSSEFSPCPTEGAKDESSHQTIGKIQIQSRASRVARIRRMQAKQISFRNAHFPEEYQFRNFELQSSTSGILIPTQPCKTIATVLVFVHSSPILGAWPNSSPRPAFPNICDMPTYARHKTFNPHSAKRLFQKTSWPTSQTRARFSLGGCRQASLLVCRHGLGPS